MKTHNYTFTGGWPLTQDRLDWSQTGWLESISAIMTAVDDGTTPVRLTGCLPSGGGYSAGYFMYQGRIIRFMPTATSPVVGGGDVLMVVISDVTTNLTYNDGTVHPAIVEEQANITAGPSTTDATQFPYGSMVDYGVQFGRMNRETTFTDYTISYSPMGEPDISGTLSVKKNKLTNMLTVHISIYMSNIGSLATSGTVWQGPLTATLPSDYIIPRTTVCNGANTSPDLLDYTSTYTINSITFKIDNAGDVYVCVPRSHGDVDFSANLSIDLPLDL